MSQQEQYRKIAKNTIVLGGSQLVQMMVLLVRAKVLAILLGPAGVGINTLILSALSIMQQVSSVGIFQSGVREMSVVTGNDNSGRKLAIFRSIFLRLSLFCGVGGVVIMVVLSPLFSLLLFGDYSYTWWLVFISLALLFMSLQSGYGVIMQATQNLSLMAKATIWGAIGGLVLAVSFLYFFGIYGIVPSIVVNYLLFYLAFKYFERNISFEESENYTRSEFIDQSKPILKLGVALMASTVVASLFVFILNLFIRYFGSVEDVGYYQSAASIVTQGMSIANIILASDFFSRLSVVHTDNEQMKNIIKQQTDILFYTITPIAVLIIAWAPNIVWILLSPKFSVVVELLQIMSIALIFKVMWLMMSFIILAKGDRKGYFFFDALLGSGINFLTSIAGYYWGGLNGLALAYLIGAIFMVVLLWMVTKIRCGVTLSLKTLLHMVGLAVFIAIAYLVSTYTQGVINFYVLLFLCILIVSYSLFQLNKKIDFLVLIKEKLLK